MHKEEKVYVPELIFGHLLTSSNYNDAEEKVSNALALLLTLYAAPVTARSHSECI